jgi:hypothetical protein
MKVVHVLVTFCALILLSCEAPVQMSSIDRENWNKRRTEINPADSLEFGKSYLSVYSQIYSHSEHRTHNLTAMISMRNTSDKDTIYLLHALYFDTHGNLLRSYFDFPIYMAPLETTEIIIDEMDVSGGTGSNFIFEWKIPKDCPESLFDGVMTSTMGQQGLSFTTMGHRIN